MFAFVNLLNVQEVSSCGLLVRVSPRISSIKADSLRRESKLMCQRVYLSLMVKVKCTETIRCTANFKMQ